MTLVVINSVAVAVAGLIGYRLLRSSESIVGLVYLVARLAEAILLVGGIVLAELAGLGDADTTGYLLAMIALGAGSISFCRSVGRHRWVPQHLATWGMYGYSALALGALIDVATDSSVAAIFAAPGGLFEVVLGAYLVRHGFRRVTTRPRRDHTGRSEGHDQHLVAPDREVERHVVAYRTP